MNPNINHLQEIFIEVANISHQTAWNEYVKNHPSGLFFHRYEWGPIHEKAYGFKPIYFWAKNESGKVVGVFPLFITHSFLFGKALKSFPYHVEGGITADHPSIEKKLLLKAMETKDSLRCGLIDIKTRNDWGGMDLPIQPITYQKYYRYILALQSNPNAILKSFRSDIRNAIGRARRKGVTVELGKSKDDLKIFYDQYTLWSKGIGLPGHSYRFFELIWDAFFPQNRVNVSIARVGKKPVGAKLFLIDPDRKIILQNWGALDFSYRNFQVNTALLWEEINWACQNGFESFDFGVTSQHHEGSNFFKAGWNTEKILVNFYYFGPQNFKAKRDDHHAFPLFRVVWKRMPKFIIRNLGHYILRQGN